MQTTSDTVFKLKFFMQLTKQICDIWSRCWENPKQIYKRSCWKINWGTTYLNYCKNIDIGEGIPCDLKKKLGKKWISLLHLNEFNLNDGFENYIVAKIFDAPSNHKWYGRKKNTQFKMLY